MLRQIALEHGVIFQDPTILHVAQLLRSEVLSGGLAGELYVESLRNLLAVHLLRNHAGITTSGIATPKAEAQLELEAQAAPGLH